MVEPASARAKVRMTGTSRRTPGWHRGDMAVTKGGVHQGISVNLSGAVGRREAVNGVLAATKTIDKKQPARCQLSVGWRYPFSHLTL